MDIFLIIVCLIFFIVVFIASLGHKIAFFWYPIILCIVLKLLGMEVPVDKILALMAEKIPQNPPEKTLKKSPINYSEKPPIVPQKSPVKLDTVNDEKDNLDKYFPGKTKVTTKLTWT
jgi:hypothetical protein